MIEDVFNVSKGRLKRKWWARNLPKIYIGIVDSRSCNTSTTHMMHYY